MGRHNPPFFARTIRYNSSMDRDILANLPIVLAVAERNGFGAAAKQLGMTPSNVSHAVRLVEDRLGTPLFARSTRSVALTEAGHALLAQLAPAIDDMDRAWESQRSRKGRPSGRLRLTIPKVAQPGILTHILAEMTRRYPDVTVEAYTEDALSDVVGEGFDAGIRSGDVIAGDMVSVRLTPPFRTVIAASPGYIARKGRPKSIADLDKHVLIGYRLTSAKSLWRWEFEDTRRAVAYETKCPVIVNDGLHAIALAAEGLGIAYAWEPSAREHLAAGRLIELLPQHATQKPGLFLYFPKRASMAPKLRAFITVARDITRNLASE
jgi:DNA-binding transcriptional LysR family regulator